MSSTYTHISTHTCKYSHVSAVFHAVPSLSHFVPSPPRQGPAAVFGCLLRRTLHMTDTICCLCKTVGHCFYCQQPFAMHYSVTKNADLFLHTVLISFFKFLYTSSFTKLFCAICRSQQYGGTCLPRHIRKPLLLGLKSAPVPHPLPPPAGTSL